MTTYLPARTIKKLKNNSKPFGLVSKGLQDIFKNLAIEGVPMLVYTRNGWGYAPKFCYHWDKTYRLPKNADVRPGIKPRSCDSGPALRALLTSGNTNKFRATVNLQDGTSVTSDYIAVDEKFFVDANTGKMPMVSSVTVLALLPRVSSVTIPV